MVAVGRGGSGVFDGVSEGFKVFVFVGWGVLLGVGVFDGVRDGVLVGVIVEVIEGVNVGNLVGMMGLGVIVTLGVGVNEAVRVGFGVSCGWVLSLILTKAYPKP